MIDKDTEAIIEGILDDVRIELHEAINAFPPIRSAHEGVAIVEEEFLEFRNAAYWPHKNDTDEEVEATQLAAMVVRYLMDVVIKGAPR